MVNQSKFRYDHIRNKLENSGAVEDLNAARARQLLGAGNLGVVLIRKDYSGSFAGYSRLCLGEIKGNCLVEPVLAFSVRGHHYNLFEKITELPRGYRNLMVGV